MKITHAMMASMRNEHELLTNTLEKVSYSLVREGGTRLPKFILDSLKKSRKASRSTVVKGPARKRTKLKGSIV